MLERVVGLAITPQRTMLQCGRPIPINPLSKEPAYDTYVSWEADHLCRKWTQLGARGRAVEPVGGS